METIASLLDMTKVSLKAISVGMKIIVSLADIIVYVVIL